MVLAMAWGILFGTLISLVLMPCLYAVDQDVKTWLLGRRPMRQVEKAEQTRPTHRFARR
jgi:hypothetical protein